MHIHQTKIVTTMSHSSASGLDKNPLIYIKSLSSLTFLQMLEFAIFKGHKSCKRYLIVFHIVSFGYMIPSKNLDLSCKTGLDFLGCLGREKSHPITE